MCYVNKWWWRCWWRAAVCALCLPVFVERVDMRTKKKNSALKAHPDLWFHRDVVSVWRLFLLTTAACGQRGGGVGEVGRTQSCLCATVCFSFSLPLFLFLFLNPCRASPRPLPVNDAGRAGASHALLAAVVLEAMTHREVEPWHSWNCSSQPGAESPLGSAR